MPWKFNKVYPNFWNNEENVRAFLSWLSERLSIKKYEDWYSISAQQFIDSGAKSLIHIYGGIYQIVMKYFPDFHWDALEFSKPRIPKTQNLLAYMIQNILHLQDSEVLSDYVHPILLDKASGKPMMFDVYIPRYGIAVEYESLHKKSSSDENQLSSPNLKEGICKEAGISIISIPKSWDQSEKSLEQKLKEAKLQIEEPVKNTFIK